MTDQNLHENMEEDVHRAGHQYTVVNVCGASMVVTYKYTYVCTHAHTYISAYIHIIREAAQCFFLFFLL